MRPMATAFFTTLLLWALAVGCAHLKGEPTGPAETEPIPRSELPLEASFVPVGWSETAYRLEGGTAGEVRFPTPGGGIERLLPATVRLFRFDERVNRWTELADSRYDEASGDLVGADLDPGLYTAFGWSANPVENALQRILLDASLGYGGFTEAPELSPGPEQREKQSIGAFRRDLLHSWLEVSFSYSVTSCQTKNEPGCPRECRRAAGRVILSSCRVNGVDCPQPDCCECRTGSFTERVVIPTGVLETLPTPCGSTLPGIPCPICPDGLSCPTGPFAEMPVIDPTGQTPDYAVLEELGLGVVLDDPVLRDHLHGLVEEVTGGDYPVPPSWEQEPLGPNGP